jgi:hypothetical protein
MTEYAFEVVESFNLRPLPIAAHKLVLDSRKVQIWVLLTSAHLRH